MSNVIYYVTLLKGPHLSWVFPSSAGGKGRGGRVDVLWRGVWRTGLCVGTRAGDMARGVTERMEGWTVSAWGGGGGTLVAGLGATGREGWGGGRGVGGEDKGGGKGTEAWSSPLGASWGNAAGGGGRGSATAAESLSDCGASVLFDRTKELVGLCAGGRGDVPPLARAAASAAKRSFFLRLSSAPRLELRGRRDEGGERLVARLLWELPPPRPEEVCLLLRDREEDRREDEYWKGERLRERPERLNKTNILCLNVKQWHIHFRCY